MSNNDTLVLENVPDIETIKFKYMKKWNIQITP